MNPFAIELGAAVKAASNTAFKEHVRRLKKRGIKVTVVREGESIIIRNEVPAAKRRAAFDAIRERLKKAKPARAGSLTASALVRQMRDSGRY